MARPPRKNWPVRLCWWYKYQPVKLLL